MTTVIHITKQGVLTLPVRFCGQLGLTNGNLVIADSIQEGALLRRAVPQRV